MNYASTDIDIDFADRSKAIAGLRCVDAILFDKAGALKRHPSGVYFQDIPVNPMTGMSAFPYREAEDRGYFKVDFLNQSVYDQVRDEQHLDELLAGEPLWELLAEEEFVSQLIHIHDHFEVVQAIAPRSIEDLAVVLALIRPGKRNLLNKARFEIDYAVWQSDDQSGYVFKKAHAVSYAALIVVQMNILVEKMYDEMEANGDTFFHD